MKNTTKQKLLQIGITSLVAVFAVAGISTAATTIGSTITTAGSVTVTSTDQTTGDLLSLTAPATRTSGSAIYVTDAGATGVATDNVVDLNVTSTLDTNVVDVTYAGVSTGNAIDLNMATNVAGDAINIASAATTGSAIEIDTTGIFSASMIDFDNSGDTAWTGDIFQVSAGAGAWTGDFFALDGEGAIGTGNFFDIESGDGANTGDIFNVALEASDVAVQNMVVNNAAISSGSGWLLYADTTAAWTGDAVKIDNSGDDAWTGDVVEISAGGGAWTGDFFSLDGEGAIGTGNFFDIESGDGANTGDIFNVALEASDVAVQNMVVANAAESAVDGWALAVDTSAAWVNNMIDLDMGAGISTGNVLDVTFASAAHTGNAVDLNMGTDVAGDAINIASAQTTGRAIAIDSTGILTDSLIDIDMSAGDWQGNIFEIETGGTASDGDIFNIDNEALDVATQVFVVAQNAANTADGWLMDIDSADAWTGDMFDFTSSAGIWTGDIFGIVTGGDGATGDIFDINIEAVDVETQFVKIDNDAASDQNGWLIYADVDGATTNEAIYIDDDVTAVGDGLVMDYAAITSGNIMNLIASGTTRIGGAILKIDDASNATASGPAVDINSTDVAADTSLLDLDYAGAGAASVAVVDFASSATLTAASGVSTVDEAPLLRLDAAGAQDDVALLVADGEVHFSSTSNITLDPQTQAGIIGVTTITPTASLMLLTSTGAANVLISEVGARDGQLLILISADASAAFEITIDDATNEANLSAAGALQAGDSITLVYVDADSEWVEIARSDN